jgi:hypothetical protein
MFGAECELAAVEDGLNVVEVLVRCASYVLAFGCMQSDRAASACPCAQEDVPGRG